MAYDILASCIGCTACTNRCPTDAITGARKALHVIDPALCIDCGACGVVCPVDAIRDEKGAVTVMLKKHQRPIAFVDALACVGCDKCGERCPFDCLHLGAPGGDGAQFGVMRVDEPKCTGCRECEQACPYDAIFVFRRDQVPAWLREKASAVEAGPPARAPAATAAGAP